MFQLGMRIGDRISNTSGRAVPIPCSWTLSQRNRTTRTSLRTACTERVSKRVAEPTA